MFVVSRLPSKSQQFLPTHSIIYFNSTHVISSHVLYFIVSHRTFSTEKLQFSADIHKLHGLMPFHVTLSFAALNLYERMASLQMCWPTSRQPTKKAVHAVCLHLHLHRRRWRGNYEWEIRFAFCHFLKLMHFPGEKSRYKIKNIRRFHYRIVCWYSINIADVE